ncbi:MAG: tetratricopeptide repeat protein [Verrucomicrobiota bacterium]|nr:tetratricopeptide repeat protein [Verrucomicrobiota bacterium]
MIQLFFLLLLCCGCYRVPDRLDPKVSYQLQDRHLEGLSSAFPPLSPEEKASDWGREVIIARGFAAELDLYRAVSTFKRALFLVPNPERKLEIEYDILFCYFLGKRYEDAIEAFEKSDLRAVDKTFPAYRDLLLILYECYGEMCDCEKQQCILEWMESAFPETAEKLSLSQAIRCGDLDTISCFASHFHGPSYLSELLDDYYENKKSVPKAQIFNALCPGAGYFYIGQYKSATTALLLNSLFIVAAYEFFHHGHTAGGIITLGFEAGWYFGGIYGAGEEAKFYNERLYDRYATTLLNQHNLFPVLMLEHTF